ncbi:MAG TPA: hypothetical protein PLG47_04025, partial [Candidatus Dojkabacteria bacterium]|nr:hypothetical protein [Candidatus Dojkabacteria bacterium]
NNNLVFTKEVKIESFVETIAMCDIYVYVPKVYLSHTKLYKNYKGEDYVQKIIPIKVEYLK